MKISAQFEIPYIQFLNEHGILNADTPAIISSQQVREYFKIMTLIHLFDKKAISLQRTGRMGTYAPVEGQEAIGTAIGYTLQKKDVFIPYYRDYATLYQRGAKLADILSYWGGDEQASLYSHQCHDFPLCVPIASQCQHAVGVGFALKYQKTNHIALVTIGDGGTSEGDFYEAINAAGVMNLPVIFVVINNQWAISVSREAQTRCQTLAQKAIAAGISGIQVDGNDIFALHQVLSDAIDNARHGDCKPCVIEALSYRLSDHTTADDASRYQPQHQVQQARALAPLIRLEKYILEQHIMSKSQIEAMRLSCQEEVEQTAMDYLARPAPSIQSMFDYHFESLPDYLIEQRATTFEEFDNAND